MKVVYVTSESYIDHSFTIAREMQKHLEFFVFIQGRKKTEEIANWCSVLKAEFIKRKRFRNPLGFFTDLALLLKIRKMRADLVWFNTLTIYQMVLVKILVRKFLVTVHDVETHPESTEKHGTLSARLTLKYMHRNTCVVSKTQAEIFEYKFNIRPFVFQLPAIDYFREVGLKEGGKESNEFSFFFFGSVEPYKGIETLLEAAKILESKGCRFCVNIYGRLKYNSEEITQKLCGLKNVRMDNRFIDYREVHSIYSQNDVLILPYLQVTQCGPLLIGMTENVPAICSNLKGFREYVTDGVDALIFDGSAQSLAERMEELINSPEKIIKIKKALAASALQKFSMPALYSSYIENFKSYLVN